MKVLEKDVDDNNKIVLERVNTVARCIQRLDEIALRPNPFSTPQYIDLIIDAEQQEKRIGFKGRIEFEETASNGHYTEYKIKNKESLLSPDRPKRRPGCSSGRRLWQSRHLQLQQQPDPSLLYPYLYERDEPFCQNSPVKTSEIITG